MKQALLPIGVLLGILGLSELLALPARSLEVDQSSIVRTGNSLCDQLGSSVTAGDSLESVQKLLGPAMLVAEEQEQLRAKFRELILVDPEQFPDGLQNVDQFVSYTEGSVQVYLQFRNDVLVNHQPAVFRNWRPQQDLAGQDQGLRPELSDGNQDLGGKRPAGQ